MKVKQKLKTEGSQASPTVSRGDEFSSFHPTLPLPDSPIASRLFNGDPVDSIVKDLNLDPLDLVSAATSRTQPDSSLIGEYVLQLLWSENTQDAIRSDSRYRALFDIKTPNDLTRFVTALPPRVVSTVMRLIKTKTVN